MTIFSDFLFLAAPDNRTPPLTATSYICGCSNFEWGAGQTIIAGQPPLKGYFQPARLAPESSSTAKQLLVCSFLTFTPNCMYMTCLQMSVQQACFAKVWKTAVPLGNVMVGLLVNLHALVAKLMVWWGLVLLIPWCAISATTWWVAAISISENTR